MDFMKLHYCDLVNQGEVIVIDEENLLVGTREVLIHKENEDLTLAVPFSHKD